MTRVEIPTVNDATFDGDVAHDVVMNEVTSFNEGNMDPFPLLNTVWGATAKYKFKEERKKVLKLSVRKLKQLEDPETFLCRSVLINNTMKRIQNELKEEKASKRSLVQYESDEDVGQIDKPVQVSDGICDEGESSTLSSIKTDQPPTEESSSSSSDSSSDSSSSSSSNSSSDDEEEKDESSHGNRAEGANVLQKENDIFNADVEDDLVSASDMKKKAKKRKLDTGASLEEKSTPSGPTEKHARTKSKRRDLYGEEEDLLSEVYMPPSINHPQQMIMCMEDDNQLTVPLPLRQQEANRINDSTSSLSMRCNKHPTSSGSCTITPFWSSGISTNSSDSFASYSNACNSWPMGDIGGNESQCTPVPWVTISPTAAPDSSKFQSSDSFWYSNSRTSSNAPSSPSQDRDLWSQTMSNTTSSAFSWTITKSSSDAAEASFHPGHNLDEWTNFDDDAACDGQTKSQPDSCHSWAEAKTSQGQLSQTSCWDEEKREPDQTRISDGESLFGPDDEPFRSGNYEEGDEKENALHPSKPECQTMSDTSPAGSPDSQVSDNSVASDASNSSSDSSPARSSYHPSQSDSAASSVTSDKHFSCGQSSMFGELQSVVFNGLITSLES